MLLAILAGVLSWAYLDVRSRRERTTWERPLSVAFVLVKSGTVDAASTTAFCDRLVVLSDRLEAEKNRYDGGRPFVFQCFGPVEAPAATPTSDDGLLGAIEQSYVLWRYASRVDAAAGIKKGDFDSRIYVSVRAPERSDRNFIEGVSENGGRIGTVSVELDRTMVDFALFVATHELFHTLGASDKYDASGRAMIPDGLAEPNASPRYPQRFAEVMARGRPIDPAHEEVVKTLDELAVGDATAREIGWTK